MVRHWTLERMKRFFAPAACAARYRRLGLPVPPRLREAAGEAVTEEEFNRRLHFARGRARGLPESEVAAKWREILARRRAAAAQNGNGNGHG